MSKTLRTAALVVGAVALVATGIGAGIAIAGGTTLAAGTAAVGTALGLGAGFVGTLGAISAGLSFAAAVTAKKPSLSVSGNQTKFTINKDQGIPWVVGRTSVSGWIVHRATWDHGGSKNNAYQTLFAVWSGSRVTQIEAFKVDKVTVPFSGDAAQGAYAGSMWLNTQLGAAPEAAALPATSFRPTVGGWSAFSKLSGCAAYSWTLKFDEKGKKFPSGVPAPMAVLKGDRAWDPRKDSTYPGGLGPQRAEDPSTWAYTDNPWLLALAWARGIFQNGKRVMGIGFALSAINVPAYVEAANVAEANGWTCGGVVYSTDGKWNVLKKFAAAGGGEPIQTGGLLSCMIDTPRVSLATIRTSDIIGDASVTATPSGKDRINGIIPRYRSEAHDWEIVPAALVQVPEYVAADGRPRSREITWELVQNVDQVAELATYSIVNAREFGPIVTPLKLKWIGYKPGDCLTIASPELGMESQDIIILQRSLDPASGAVTFTSRSETAAKHAFALGKTGTPPPTPSLQVLTGDELLIPGYNAGWSGVVDDDGNRPEDGATVGAPAGTYVADKLAEEVIAEALATVGLLQEERENMSKLLAGFLSAMQLAETREARAQALGFIDGEGIRTAHRREVTERVEGQTAIVTDLNLIGARSEDGSAYILNLGTVKVSPTETFGERLEEISATFAAQDGLITSSYSDLATAISNETAARTTAIETLNASIETLDGETAASIANVQDAIADEAGARATAITSVQASITGLTNSTNASVSSLNTAIANESSTRASALSSVNSTLGSHTSSITSLNSSVSSLNSTVASNYSALTATIGGLNTTVTTQSSAIATLQGRTGAFWSVVANTSSGATAFISARAETSGGSVTSNVAFGANEVHISNPSSGSGWTKVLSVSGGNVQIFGNLSATGSVSTPNLISNSVTKTVAALRGSNLTGSGGFVGIDAEAMITLAYAAEVIVLYTGFQNYTSTIPQYQSRLILYNASHSPIDSRVGPSGGAGSYETNFSFMAKFSLSAGTYYVEPQWLGGDSGIYLNAGSGVICLITYR
ncbi:DUF1983 domain-containing protein [Rhizorhabdus sp.]|uniref:phage tail tip fiber protein n=1 Tax=Rhizorhabdus sp. TaxID=1968843 RepID=UPI0035B21763